MEGRRGRGDGNKVKILNRGILNKNKETQFEFRNTGDTIYLGGTAGDMTSRKMLQPIIEGTNKTQLTWDLKFCSNNGDKGGKGIECHRFFQFGHHGHKHDICANCGKGECRAKDCGKEAD